MSETGPEAPSEEQVRLVVYQTMEQMFIQSQAAIDVLRQIEAHLVGATPNPPTTEDAQRKKVVEIMVQFQGAQFSASAAYTNLVTIGGYAGAFTIWNFVKEFMSPRASAFVATLLAASLAVFVSWNVHQMVWLMLQRLRWRVSLDGLSGQEFIDKYLELEADLNRSVFGRMMKWWVGMLVFTIACGYLALIVLLWNCGAMYFGYEGWP